MRDAWYGCASPAVRATFRWMSRRAIATRWELRCHRAWRRFSWRKEMSRWRKSSGGMRGRTGRLLRSISRRDTGCRPAASNRSCTHCTHAGSCWRENFVRADITASGATPKCCNKSGVRVWRGCGAKIEPVEQRVFARFTARWQGVTAPRRGVDALLDAIEALQGAAVPASELEREILSARIAEYKPGDLDTLMSAGEVIWVGVEPIGDRDGRIALYLAGSLPLLLTPSGSGSGSGAAFSERAQKIVEVLERQGASFFAAIHAACGGGFPGETRDAIEELVWSGRVTNDTLHPVRNLRVSNESHGKQSRGEFADQRPGSPEFLRRMRLRAPGRNLMDGRWSLVTQRAPCPGEMAISPTQWSANIARQLLLRHGIVMRETGVAENVPGGFPTIYPALKTMEDSGRIRRGMFVAGMGAAQFAMPAAVDMLRSLRLEPAKAEVVYLAATDPANPYGALLPWPRAEAEVQARKRRR